MKAIFALSLSISLAAAGLWSGYVGRAQQGSMGSAGSAYPPSSAGGRSPFGGRETDPNPLSAATREQIEKARQNDRQRRMVADTNRLVILAAELKAQADKKKSDTPSGEDARKAEEIEKLARNVKERMKG